MEIKNGELTANQSEKVSAGYNRREIEITYMYCDACSYREPWEGDFTNGYYDCPQCNEHTFHYCDIYP